jgi:hypothetical protein
VQVAAHLRLLGVWPKRTHPLGSWLAAAGIEYCAATLPRDRFLHAMAAFSAVLGYTVPEGGFNALTVIACFGRGAVLRAQWSESLRDVRAFQQEHHRWPRAKGSLLSPYERSLALWLGRQRCSKRLDELSLDRCAPTMCMWLQC